MELLLLTSLWLGLGAVFENLLRAAADRSRQVVCSPTCSRCSS